MTKNLHNLQRYRYAKERLREIKPFIKQLEFFSEFLYNNLNMEGSFELFEQVEGLMLKYYFEEMECNKIIRFKGKQ